MEDRARHRFGVEELAVVLSHYDLGVIESITEFKRGSRRSPKVGVVSERGKFLLKKRARGKRSDRKVGFSHAIQNHLADRGFPVAKLIPSCDAGAMVTRLGEETYELFEFVAGEEYAANVDQTRDAGRTLALFHQAVGDMVIPPDVSRGSYHDVNGVRTALNSLPSSISSHDSVIGFEMELGDTVETLFDEYDQAAETVNEIGGDSLPSQVVHADWHPGNMLFKHDKVVAVMDYDSCRVAERVTDVANGLLHFSLITGRHPDEWADQADEERLAAFSKGYGQVIALSDVERRCIPHLMIEAMIAESLLPIVQTGQFGRWPGFTFLRMVARKVKWIRENEQRLAELVQPEPPSAQE